MWQNSKSDKNQKCDNSKTQNVTQTQKLKIWQFQIQNVTKIKKNTKFDKTLNVTKLKNPKCDKSKCDKTQKLKIWQLKIWQLKKWQFQNSKCDKTHKLKMFFLSLGSVLRSRDILYQDGLAIIDVWLISCYFNLLWNRRGLVNG